MRLLSSSKKLPGWRELPIGIMNVNPGSSVNYDVASWRTFRPVIDQSKCTKCSLCWVYCPDAAVEIKKVDGGEVFEINYKFCKGCGICESVCPIKAIKMVEEVA